MSILDKYSNDFPTFVADFLSDLLPENSGNIQMYVKHLETKSLLRHLKNKESFFLCHLTYSSSGIQIN